MSPDTMGAGLVGRRCPPRARITDVSRCGEIQRCFRKWSGSAGGHSSPRVLSVIVPGVATQLCWKTFGNMRKGANDADDPDEVERTRVHVGPMGDNMDQVIVVQIGHVT